MKIPYLTAAQHADAQDGEQLRERMLERRLVNRDDVREIYVVTTPIPGLLSSPIADRLVKRVSDKSQTDLSWIMHWAIQVSDQYFELRLTREDPSRTELRMSKWGQQKQDQIHQRYFQGVTAMTNDEIAAVGVKHFTWLDKMDINKYNIWCNNCQLAVDRMLRDIGGLRHHRSQLKSLPDWIRQFFRDSILSMVQWYFRHRGCDNANETLSRHEEMLRIAIDELIPHSINYPKRRYIREDIKMAEGFMKKIGAIESHWFLTVLEAYLSLRKKSVKSYVHRGADGKPQPNHDAIIEAVKEEIDQESKYAVVGWLKVLPWLTAGTFIGTAKWAVAVIYLAVSNVSQLTEFHMRHQGGSKEPIKRSYGSPKQYNVQSTSSNGIKPRVRRLPTNETRIIGIQSGSIDNQLVPRYERCLTSTGVPYFFDHKNKSRSWEAPNQQEMCLKITNPSLPRRWEERQEEGRVFYVNCITGETTDTRPGKAEIWVAKKQVKPDWVKSTIMALPFGWEIRHTEEGEKYYLDHKNNPPTSTKLHPMRREIEEERRTLLPEWNVEWDEDRGKKYRNLHNGEIRWKEVSGPQHVLADDEPKSASKKTRKNFVEPLPPGWILNVEADGQKTYKNRKEGVERLTHPLTDKRRRLLPDWEMRYTWAKRRYWIHHGHNGRGTSWWTRNRLLKNTSLKNNASGWKLTKGGNDWEWFEGGDVPHSNMPILDLDDPAEFEFREYPFILPSRLTDQDGSFIEPLPPHWVRRTNEDGCIYYWNFKTETRSDEHPNEEERRSLPAFWEMRYTRHGRPYFHHHNNGATYWTQPRLHGVKQDQKPRAGPGQRQDGWKIAEDGKSWERFMDGPDASKIAEQSTDDLTRAQSADSDEVRERDGEGEETWRDLVFTREWLKAVGENDFTAAGMARFNGLVKTLQKAEISPNIGRQVWRSPRKSIEEEPEEPRSGGRTESQSSPQSKDPRKLISNRTSSLLILKKLKGRGKQRDESRAGLEPDEEEDLRNESGTTTDGLGLSATDGFRTMAVVESPEEEGEGGPGYLEPVMEDHGGGHDMEEDSEKNGTREDGDASGEGSNERGEGLP